MIDLWDKQKEVTGGRPYHASPFDLAVTDDHVIILANVTAEWDDKPYTFRTANVCRVAEGRVAECRPHVFDLHAFDEFWS